MTRPDDRHDVSNASSKAIKFHFSAALSRLNETFSMEIFSIMNKRSYVSVTSLRPLDRSIQIAHRFTEAKHAGIIETQKQDLLPRPASILSDIGEATSFSVFDFREFL